MKQSVRWTVLLAFPLAVGSGLIAATGKECLELSTTRDLDVSSPTGIQVTVSAQNRCAESVEARSTRFKVTVSAGGVDLASRSGSFQAAIEAHGRAETKLFIPCDADRVRAVRVASD